MTHIRLRYQTIEFADHDIHLRTLKNNQQFDDPEGIAEALGISSAQWPLFGVVWPSGVILAEVVDEFDTSGKRILEIGCGMALPSLLLNAKAEDITATDYHPETAIFLEQNTSLNEDQPIPYERTGWADKNDKLGEFDLIIGSDLLYEDEHIALLANFINAHAKQVSEVILVDPGRGRKNKMIRAMNEFGFTNELLSHPEETSLETEFKGHIIKFVRA